MGADSAAKEGTSSTGRVAGVIGPLPYVDSRPLSGGLWHWHLARALSYYLSNQ